MKRSENLSKEPLPSTVTQLVDWDSFQSLGPPHGVDITDIATINRYDDDVTDSSTINKIVLFLYANSHYSVILLLDYLVECMTSAAKVSSWSLDTCHLFHLEPTVQATRRY